MSADRQVSGVPPRSGVRTAAIGAACASALDLLVVSHDGDDYVLGRPDLGRYVVVPEPGAVFVTALRAGEPVAAATARASRVAGTEVDGADFLEGLAAAGMFDMPTPTTTREPASGTGPARRIRWIKGVSPSAARPLFGPVAWSGYALATATVVALLIAVPPLRPTFEHWWWLPDPVLSVLLLLPPAWLLAGVHEAWHWLAGRSIGVPAVFRVSYRGIFLVFETDLTQLAGTPRRLRYRVFLAGLAIDVTLLAVALVLRLAYRTDVISMAGWVDRLLAALALNLMFGMVWQWAALVLRTDGYALLANALRCHDLARATRLVTKDRLLGLTEGETAELAAIGDRDRAVARWFGLLYLAGLVVMGWLLLRYAVPFGASMVWWVGDNVVHPVIASVTFWESAAVLAVVIGQYAVVPLLALRERRLRRAGVLR